MYNGNDNNGNDNNGNDNNGNDNNGNDNNGNLPGDGGESNPGVTSNNGGSQQASTDLTSGRILTGTVMSVVLNLRKNPGVEQSPLDTLFRGDVVQILGRTADGTWWLVCCGARARLQGWATAASIQPSFAISQVNALIPVVAGQSTALSASASITGTRPTITNTASLQVEMRPSPAFAWQGQPVAIQFVITNRGSVAATNIRLRDHLPPTLRYVKAVVANQGQLQTQTSAEGGAIVNLAWPRLAPGASMIATITVQIAPDAPAGSLIDNLALVTANQQDDVSVAITLAMPPALLPQFNGR